MREIKFRARSLRSGKWLYGDLTRVNGRTYIHDDGVEEQVVSETVGEYVGLKGKNGVEIYEGDVIDTHVKNGRYMKVYYNSDCVSFMTAGLGDISWVKTGGLSKDMCSYIEVIGNIYENLELLELSA